MRYSATDHSTIVDFRQAVEHSYASDGNALYLPATITQLPAAYFKNIDQMKLNEIAYVVTSTLLGGEFTPSAMKDIVDEAFNFPIPVVACAGDLFVTELFHGPTMAFKDVGARFLAACLKRMKRPSHINVVVATTGNTGGAVANALSGFDGIDVLVLFPRGTLTRAQQSQFCTSASNVHPIEVGGSIAQCREMAREAVTDPTNPVKTICANTHNILRTIPQVAFFFHTYAQLRRMIGARADGFEVAIPCGNLSNLTAAVIAKRMGLPMGRIIAGCNANDDFARLVDGSIAPQRLNRTARPTLAHAMDTGMPANLPRLHALYGDSLEAMRADIATASIDDAQIAQTIQLSISRHGCMPDPHTAVAIAAATACRTPGIPVAVLATAHPAKSLDTMTAITGRTVELPLQFTRFMSKPVSPVKMAPTYAALKKYIIANS